MGNLALVNLLDLHPPEGFDPEIAILLAGLVDSQREWLENLGKPSAEAMVWTERPGGPSIGSQILHMADCELFWFEQFVGGQPPDADLETRLMTYQIKVEKGQWPEPPKKPLKWYLELHAEVATRSRQWLQGVAATHIIQGRTKSITARWVVSHVMQHDSYHGGQAVLLHENYKRLRKAASGPPS
ncbi:MAG TPA: DinB family protein [Fimbriimonadaceae bacterium]|nr:DinB family protein [Fimbriimonadaceae bacterium]